MLDTERFVMRLERILDALSEREAPRLDRAFTRRSLFRAGLLASLALIPSRRLFAACQRTTADGRGPLYVAGAPIRSSLCGPAEPGQRLVISGVVKTEECRPLAGAILDLWQANDRGLYSTGASDGFNLRGKVQAGADGHYAFQTILPGAYGGRPRHIHLTVRHPNAAELTTQIYFQGDERARNEDPARVLALSGTTELAATFDIGLELA